MLTWLRRQLKQISREAVSEGVADRFTEEHARLEQMQREQSRLLESLQTQQSQALQEQAAKFDAQLSRLQDEVRHKDQVLTAQQATADELAAKFDAHLSRLKDDVRHKDEVLKAQQATAEEQAAKLEAQLTLLSDRLVRAQDLEAKLEAALQDLADLSSRLHIKEQARLPEFYQQRLGKLDPDSADCIREMEEVAAIQRTLRQDRPSEIIWEHHGKKTPLVSIVVPLYFNQELACRLLSYLDQTTAFRDFEVIVVNDNPSEPLVPEIRKPEYRFPIKVLQNTWNMGYPAATNAGCELATGQMLLLLNSDILPKREDWLDRILETMESDPQVAIVGAKTLYHQTGIIEHFGMFSLYDPVLDCYHNKHYFDGIEDGLFAETQIDQEVDMVTGAAMMIQASLFRELNGLNTRYAVGGFEDADLCRRAHELGYRVLVSAGCVLDHHKSVSLAKSPVFNEKIFACNRRYYHHLWRENLDERKKRRTLVPSLRKADSKIRVLFVAHGYPPEQIGGTEVYNKNLAEAVAGLDDFEPVILTAAPVQGPGSQDGLIAQNRRAESRIPVFSCFRSAPNFVNEHALAEHEFDRLLCSLRPDVVHFNHVERLSSNYLKIAKDSGAFVLFTFQEFLPICPANGHLVYKDGSICNGPETQKCAECVSWDAREVAHRAALYRDNFSFVDLFIAPSHQIRDRYIQWGLSPERILFSNYGLPLPAIKRKKRQGPGLKFSYIGQIIPHKGTMLLLDALDLLAKQAGGKYEMHIHGWTPDWEKEFLKTFQSRAGQMKDVSFHGPYERSHVYDIIADTDVVVVPSIWPENSPITIQEAFAMKVPVITADIGGMKELVIDGENGLLFRWKDPADLCEKMRVVIDQPELLSRFSANLANRPVKSIEQNARELAEIYSSHFSRTRLKA